MSDTWAKNASAVDSRSFSPHAFQTVIYERVSDLDRRECFFGQLESCELGRVQLTRLHFAPESCGRHDHHSDDRSDYIFVCLPINGKVELHQINRTVQVEPGQFLLEHSNVSFTLVVEQFSDIWLLRIPDEMISARVRNPLRFCTMCFAAHEGAGKLFNDYIDSAARNITRSGGNVRSKVGVHLIDLLSAVLEADPRVLPFCGSIVRNAHLERAELYLRQNFDMYRLSPEMVASACGISVRYLHQIFAETGQTVSQWIREHRLELAYEAVRAATRKPSIAQIAYQHGFNDHAQFSTAFKKKYGCTPSEVFAKRLSPTSGDNPMQSIPYFST